MHEGWGAEPCSGLAAAPSSAHGGDRWVEAARAGVPLQDGHQLAFGDGGRLQMEKAKVGVTRDGQGHQLPLTEQHTRCPLLVVWG